MKKTRMYEFLHNALVFIIDIPYVVLEYLMAHRWAANLVGIVVGTLAGLLILLLLTFLIAAGCIPPPPVWGWR